MKLIKKGAEAYLYLDDWYGIKVIRKVRISKQYRVKIFDNYLRKSRTLNEAKLLFSAKSIGVPVPAVFDVDVTNSTIIMEFIPGVLLRDYLPQASNKELRQLFEVIGKYVGLLHSNGIFHGDLTTSNMILCNGKPFLIDFGLGGFSKEIEHLGVDIHLMLRALESTHYKVINECFSAFIKGYSQVFNKYNLVLRKVKEIRLRGRYVIERRVKK
ncbi:MAG: Kae1-associated kinase Bud32 [Candidatus Methanomethylicota archaeon]|uniref:non-specific serine/threonine protein kinase n=1 Tax=Thermoproteota archaeon TaxID=2056631 RepID=A0A497EW83_9CREN|nr:MAG: Kae1-associated kinase Bud32 [Candidatus Verstraetearchaeota archaeon]